MMSRKLAVLVAAAAGLAVLVWLDRRQGDAPGEDRVAAVGELAEAADETGDAPGAAQILAARDARNPLAGLRRETLTETVARPLFTPGRRPPARRVATPRRPPPAPPPRPQTRQNHFKLLGVAGGGPGRIALLKDRRSGRHFRVEPGDQIDGWRVERVGATEIALIHGEQRVTLTVHGR